MMYLPSYEATGMGSTLAQFAGIEDGIHLVAKLTRSRIEPILARYYTFYSYTPA